MDVGLIGFGLAGRVFHAPIIRAVPGLQLSAIVQRTRSDAANLYPEARLVRSVDELLSIDNLQLVVVATPNSSHYEIARQCLLAGRNVVVEKPITPTWTQANDLAELARKKDVVLSVYQNRRWDGDFLTVQRLLETKAMGRIVLYESRFDRYRPELRPNAWREQDQPGSGLFFDLGVHLIDQAVQLFGPPETVSADIRAEREGAVVDDAFEVNLRYSNLRATLCASMLRRMPTARFALHGVLGSYVKQGLDPQEEALKRGETPTGHSWGKEPASAWGILSSAEGESRSIPTVRGDYRGFYENVRDAMLGKASLAVTPGQALDVLRIMEMARESSASGRSIEWKGN